MSKYEDFLKFENGNLIPEPVPAQKCIDILKAFFLGEDYYIALPCNQEQANAIITDAILSKFPNEYRKFCNKQRHIEPIVNVADKVYLFDKDLNIHELVVTKYYTTADYSVCFAQNKINGKWISRVFHSYEFGKTVFVSKEEAEEKKKRYRGKLWLMKRKIVRM